MKYISVFCLFFSFLKSSIMKFKCSLLLDTKEVFNLKTSILFKISAVNGVNSPWVSKFGSYRVLSQVFGDFRVHWSAEFSEALDCVLLSDFHHDARTWGHVLNHAYKLRKDAFIDLKELLGSWSVKAKHLHWGNFETFLEYHVDNLSGEALLHDVGLDDGASAVVESSSWPKNFRKEESWLPAELRGWTTTMNSVPHAIRAKNSSKSVLRVSWISWSNNISEARNGILFNQLHSSYNIRGHIGGEVGEERLASMLSVEFISLLHLSKFAHLQFRNLKTVSINCIDDFSSLSVTVRFNHCKSFFRFCFKLLSGKHISILNKLKLSRMNINDWPNIQLVTWNTWAGHSLHEHSSVF